MTVFFKVTVVVYFLNGKLNSDVRSLRLLPAKPRGVVCLALVCTKCKLLGQRILVLKCKMLGWGVFITTRCIDLRCIIVVELGYFQTG